MSVRVTLNRLKLGKPCHVAIINRIPGSDMDGPRDASAAVMSISGPL